MLAELNKWEQDRKPQAKADGRMQLELRANRKFDKFATKKKCSNQKQTLQRGKFNAPQIISARERNAQKQKVKR